MIVRELLARLGLKVDNSGFDQAKSAFAGLATGMAKLGSLALAAKGALLAVVQSTADQAREIENTARITGLSTDHVQELGYAAKRTGVSAEEMRMSLVHLARSATEAPQGGAEAAGAYFKLGISTTDANGKVRPLSQLLAEVSARFSQMPDGTEKAAMAMRLFGRSGAELIPFLDKGPAGIGALGAQAKALGAVMGGAALAGAARYRATMGQLGATIDAVKYAVSERLFPAFARSAQQFAQWLAVHRQFIALKVEQAFKVISDVLRGMVSIGERIYGVFNRLWSSGGAGKSVIIALGAAILGLTAPWMGLIGILALVGNSFEMYLEGKDSLVGRIIYAFERLGAAISGPFKTIKKKFDEFWTEFKTKWEEFKTDPLGFLYSAIKPFLDSLVKQTKAAIDELKLYAKGDTPEQVTAARAADKAGEDELKTAARTMWQSIKYDFGIETPPQWLPPAAIATSAAGGAPSGAGMSFSIGELHLNGADTTGDPATFGKQLSESFLEHIDSHWAAKLREAGKHVDR